MGKPYKRVLIKVSGEALMGSSVASLDKQTLATIAHDIALAAKTTQIAVVVGGGNFIRGSLFEGADLNRATADNMGMLATLINAIALEQALEAAGQSARAMSVVPAPSLLESYCRAKALDHLAHNRVVIVGGGTGNPYFTTDTASVLRAAEMECEAVLKATQVDGIYTSDPKKDPNAKRYETLTHAQALAQNIKVMDTAAFALAQERHLPIVVFSIQTPNAISQAVAGNGLSTLVTP